MGAREGGQTALAIRAVTIDFWGTLLFDPPSSDDAYRRRRVAEFEAILRAAGVRVTRADLDRAYEASGAFLGRIWRENRDVPVERHVEAILDALGPGVAGRLPPRTMPALVEAYARPALLVPPAVDEGAGGALAALAGRGVTLCVVSNTMRTPGATLRELLRHYGLLDYFAHLTFSDECGIRKPDPEIFRLTLRAAGAPAEAAVHVGDDPILDVQGARAAGMRVIQVTRRGVRPDAAAFPDATIPGLAALPEALARLERVESR